MPTTIPGPNITPVPLGTAFGAILYLKSGVPIDADFTNVIDGIFVSDIVGLNTFLRLGGIWRPYTGPILSKMAVMLTDDEVQVSNSVTNTDATQKSYALAPNSYSKIVVEAEGYANTAGTTLQDVNLKLFDGAVQVGNTTIFRDSVGAPLNRFKMPFRISATFVEQTAKTLKFTIGAAAVDGNMFVLTNVFRVWGVYA